MTGWFTVVFFGAAMVVAACQLIAPGELVVTPSAIEVSSLGRKYSRDLVGCSEFTVWRNPVARQDLVVFDHPLDSSKRAARWSKQVSGHSSGLPDTFGMDAVELARVLNGARSTALAAAGKA